MAIMHLSATVFLQLGSGNILVTDIKLYTSFYLNCLLRLVIVKIIIFNLNIQFH